MAICTSCGCTFHHAAITPGKAVSRVHNLSMAFNSFIIIGGLVAEEVFIDGSGGTTASKHPRWDFWVAFHKVVALTAIRVGPSALAP